jgi:hypothetical protein
MWCRPGISRLEGNLSSSAVGNLMMFHPEKCTTIHISKKRNPIHTGYKLHGRTLESVPGSKYLGVHVNKDLSWNDPIVVVAAFW